MLQGWSSPHVWTRTRKGGEVSGLEGLEDEEAQQRTDRSRLEDGYKEQ